MLVSLDYWKIYGMSLESAVYVFNNYDNDRVAKLVLSYTKSMFLVFFWFRTVSRASGHKRFNIFGMTQLMLLVLLVSPKYM